MAASESASVARPTSIRRALSPLPVTPMNKRVVTTTMDTPPPSLLTVRTKAGPTPANADALTPPVTPMSPRMNKAILTDKSTGHGGTIDDSSIDNKGRSHSEEIMTQGPSSGVPEQLLWSRITPKLYAGTYHLLEVYGRGAWSTVHRALEKEAVHISAATPLTPPTSPQRRPQRFLAIKAPVHKGSYPVIEKEACILTYLHTYPSASEYIVNFHGFSLSTHSLILAAVPLTLESHTRSALAHATANLTTRTMFDPVIGAAQWTSLAKALISGLAYLHSRHCVHGDIKPANILLQPLPSSEAEPAAHKPLYADFSSSAVIFPDSPPRPIDPANDAITPAFTAPELLANYAKGGAVTTFASDVFSLGVTMLVAATGELPYGGPMQRLAVAREGRPMDFARSGEQGSRIMKGGLVEKVLLRSLARDPEMRVDAKAWQKIMDEM